MAKRTITKEELEVPPQLPNEYVSTGDLRFGETSQSYDGEADVAAIAKINNMRRVYLQNGLPWPPGSTPSNLPIIEILSPENAEIGSAVVTIYITGSNFTPEAKVLFSDVEQETFIIDDVTVAAEIDPGLATEPVSVGIRVRTVNGDSNKLEFYFVEPETPARAKK